MCYILRLHFLFLSFLYALRIDKSSLLLKMYNRHSLCEHVCALFCDEHHVFCLGTPGTILGDI